jgi:hypothetical protein
MEMEQKILDNPVPDIQFQDDDPEVVFVASEDEIPKEEGTELPEEYQGKSASEIAAEALKYKAQANSTETITQGFAALQETLSKPQQATSPPAPTPKKERITREEFNKELFGDDPKGVIDRYFAEKQEELTQANAGNVYLAKQVAKTGPDGEFVVKHEAEIDQMIMTLPVNQRTNPAAVDWALKQVKAAHVDDLVDERVDAAVEKKLAEMGITGGSQGGQRKPSQQGTYTDGGGRAKPRKRQYVTITDEDRAAAKRKNMKIEDYMKYGKRG